MHFNHLFSEDLNPLQASTPARNISPVATPAPAPPPAPAPGLRLFSPPPPPPPVQRLFSPPPAGRFSPLPQESEGITEQLRQGKKLVL